MMIMKKIHFRCNDQGGDNLGNHDDDAWAVQEVYCQKYDDDINY